MATIFIARQLPGTSVARLRDAGHEVIVSELDRPLTAEELLAAMQERSYDAVVSLLSDHIDAIFFDAAPSVRLVSNYAVGYNNISVAEAAKRQVVVTNTPGVLTDSVAEFTIALMLAIMKRIPESDRFVRSGAFEGWAPELLLGTDLTGKTLGILGAGRIGRGVAVRAQRGLGMRIVYNDMQPCAELESDIPCEYSESVEELLEQADVVSVHVPLLDTTRHLINAERLAHMKATAYIINTSRGPVIDEAALVTALQTGVIRGAALDVFEHEPALAPGLAQLENVVLTPHTASASEETRIKMADMVADNILAFFNGEIPPNVVAAA